MGRLNIIITWQNRRLYTEFGCSLNIYTYSCKKTPSVSLSAAMFQSWYCNVTVLKTGISLRWTPSVSLSSVPLKICFPKELAIFSVWSRVFPIQYNKTTVQPSIIPSETFLFEKTKPNKKTLHPSPPTTHTLVLPPYY